MANHKAKGLALRQRAGLGLCSKGLVGEVEVQCSQGKEQGDQVNVKLEAEFCFAFMEHQ